MALSELDFSNPEKIRIAEGGRSVGLFCMELPARVDTGLVRELEAMACRYGNRNIRLCLHAGPTDLFHSMVILESAGRYYRPHRHREKGECFHIIKGRMAVFAFDDAGAITDACALEPQNVFMYRVRMGMYHAVMPLSPTVIYHESKLGPFLGEKDSIFASWSPDGEDEEEASRYSRSLLRALERSAPENA